MVNQDLAHKQNQGQKGIVVYESFNGAVSLDVKVVREVIYKGEHKITDFEAYGFMQFCKAYQLNPFANREAYLVKFDPKQPADFVIGVGHYLNRADLHPAYQGVRAGIIVEKDGDREEVEGTVKPAGATLVGGWATVERSDRIPMTKRCPLDEYIQTTRDGQPRRFWKTSPGNQIMTTALRQALRDAFPSMFSGLPSADEIRADQVDHETGEVIEGDTVVAEDGPAVTTESSALFGGEPEPPRDEQNGAKGQSSAPEEPPGFDNPQAVAKWAKDTYDLTLQETMEAVKVKVREKIPTHGSVRGVIRKYAIEKNQQLPMNGDE